MKATLICPYDYCAVSALGSRHPFVAAPVCGKSFIGYWLDHFEEEGCSEIRVLTSDRPAELRELIQKEGPWRCDIRVVPLSRRQGVAVLETAHQWNGGSDNRVEVVDHFPGRQAKVFEGYDTWLNESLAWLQGMSPRERVGIQEVRAGIRVGWGASLGNAHQLYEPCWIGEKAHIGPDAVVGPNAIIEDRAIVESRARVTDAQVAPDTYVGADLEVSGKLAVGDCLIDVRTGSSTKTGDPLLLGDLRRKRRASSMLGRIVALGLVGATAPIIGVWAVGRMVKGEPVFEQSRVVCGYDPSTETLRVVPHRKLAGVTGIWQRWPELWQIVRGELRWVGNRPLSETEVDMLEDPFREVWLQGPAGVLSLIDVSRTDDTNDDETKAHASYYAAMRNWRLDAQILLKLITMRLARWILPKNKP